MEAIPSPVCITYAIDSDGALYNSEGFEEDGLVENHDSHFISVFDTPGIPRSEIFDIYTSSNVKWTRFSFPFKFHVGDEHLVGRFESILTSCIPFHENLCPTVKVKKCISDSSVKSILVSPTICSCIDDIYTAQSKPLSDGRYIVLTYDLYIKAIGRPLSHIFLPFKRQDYNVPSLPEALQVLSRRIHGHFEHCLAFLLLLLEDIQEVHSSGNCCNNLHLDSFIMYIPQTSLTDGDNDGMQSPFGVQLIGHWKCTSAGLLESDVSKSIRQFGNMWVTQYLNNYVS